MSTPLPPNLFEVTQKKFARASPRDILVIYHGDCFDGFGAAYAAWKRFGDDATYHPASHANKTLPNITDKKSVYILDFSYPREDLIALSEKVNLTVIDHHKTAQADLEGLPFAVFDMDKSGAVLAWEHFHDRPMPIFLKYVQDRDLWRYELPNSKEVNAAISTYEFDFETWDTELQDIRKLAEMGEHILRHIERQIERAVQHTVLVDMGGVTVPAVNSPLFNSEIANYLVENLNSPVGATWGVNSTGRAWSLRSDGSVDVSAIAQQFGGGGHHDAAGFGEGNPGEFVNIPIPQEPIDVKTVFESLGREEDFLSPRGREPINFFVCAPTSDIISSVCENGENFHGEGDKVGEEFLEFVRGCLEEGRKGQFWSWSGHSWSTILRHYDELPDELPYHGFSVYQELERLGKVLDQKPQSDSALKRAYLLKDIHKKHIDTVEEITTTADVGQIPVPFKKDDEDDNLS